MKILYYECFSGISGDMNMAALIDLGVPFEFLKNELEKLSVGGYTLKLGKEIRKGISGTQINVLIDDVAEENKKHRHLSTINKIIDDSDLSNKVKEDSKGIFRIIAESEAKIHDKTIESIHFHEVGAIDSIVDIVGAAICKNYLNPDKIICSAVELGGGFVKCAHGLMPVPAPATADILSGIPTSRGAVNFETTTPTGAAILKYYVDEFIINPNLVLQSTAYGIGHKDFDIPNVLRVNSANQIQNSQSNTDQVNLLETNIDDLQAEVLGFVKSKLVESGALDVYLTPVQMKKDRPGNILSVICSDEHKEKLIEIIFNETGTLGIRDQKISRHVLQRKTENFASSLGNIDIKSSFFAGNLVNYKPEFEQCRIISNNTGIPLKSVIDIVKNEYQTKHGITTKV